MEELVRFVGSQSFLFVVLVAVPLLWFFTRSISGAVSVAGLAALTWYTAQPVVKELDFVALKNGVVVASTQPAGNVTTSQIHRGLLTAETTVETGIGRFLVDGETVVASGVPAAIVTRARQGETRRFLCFGATRGECRSIRDGGLNPAPAAAKANS